MTREDAKKLLPIIKAYSEGKTVQTLYDSINNEWEDLSEPAFNACPFIYRIKPESTYRPFNNRKECLEEMMKHKPFGLVEYDDIFISIVNIYNFGIEYLYYGDPVTLNYKEAISHLKFIDGAPFGIKEN